MTTTGPEAHLARSVEKLNDTIEKLRTELVRKDVYAEARRADQQAVREVEKDVADLLEWRKWLSRGVLASLFISIVPSLVMLYISTQVIR